MCRMVTVPQITLALLNMYRTGRSVLLKGTAAIWFAAILILLVMFR